MLTTVMKIVNKTSHTPFVVNTNHMLICASVYNNHCSNMKLTINENVCVKVKQVLKSRFCVLSYDSYKQFTQYEDGLMCKTFIISLVNSVYLSYLQTFKAVLPWLSSICIFAPL